MKLVKLERVISSPHCTVGRLTINGIDWYCYTLELPWRDNIPFISRIPDGTYKLKKGMFGREYVDYELIDVPNRQNIEIHVANYVRELKGCISLGEQFYRLQDFEFYLVRSRKAHNKFIELMGGDDEAMINVFMCNGAGVDLDA